MSALPRHPHYLPDLGQLRVVSVGMDQAITLTMESAREIAAEWREDAGRNVSSPTCRARYEAMALDADAAAARVEAEARRYPERARLRGVVLQQVAA